MTIKNTFLPYGRQTIDDGDVRAVEAALRGDWLTTGPKVAEFEKALAEKVGTKYAISCSNCTAALHLAVMALGIGSGDSVIVPAITFLATANVVRLTGAEVVFADVNPHTGLMGPEHLEKAIENHAGQTRLRAVIPVHMAGQCAAPQANHKIAREHDLHVIEDAAHAIGTTYLDNAQKIPVGACAHSDMTCFSFHPVKTITMGEGGVITTNDEKLAERLFQLRQGGMTKNADGFVQEDLARDDSGVLNPWYYEMHEPGLNYRANDLQCALGLSQLGKLERYIEIRRDLVAQYDDALGSLAPNLLPLGRVRGCAPGWHLYPVLIDFHTIGYSRAAFMDILKDAGVGTQVHYIPVHMQPYYRARYGDISLPGSKAYYEKTLSLPLFAGMGKEDVEKVASTIHQIIRSGASR